MARQFLSKADVPADRVRCPIHGFIRYSKNERKIVDHPVFQRLRNVRQLAMEYLVYPGAMHTRFEHSLGVMHMAGQMFEVLQERHAERIECNLKEVPELAEDTLAKARQLVRLMGLLHDVGHPAFAHAGEAGIPAKDHEEVSIYAMEHVLGAVLDSTFFPGVSALLVRLMSKKYPALAFLSQIVSGEMDADRADYLLRDSWHCGVRYGVYDWDRLLESLTLVDDPDTGRLVIALERGGEHTFEAMILARYQMSTQVYFHKIRRIYDHYLAEYNKLWGPENYHSIEDVLHHDDLSVFEQIRTDAAGDSPRTRWARRIVHRDHHRVIYETSDSADHNDLQVARRLLNAIREKFTDVDLLLDDSPLTIYKLSIPGDQEEQKVEHLYVLERNGKPKPLTYQSAIISKVPKRVRTVRIFADARDGLLGNIRNEVKLLENNV
jgi:HD superfamily phosphohydrolase